MALTKFYTSVERYGNNILHRGYENGKRFSYRVPFQPTLYVHTPKSGAEGYHSLEGNLPVSPHKFGDIRITLLNSFKKNTQTRLPMM